MVLVVAINLDVGGLGLLVFISVTLYDLLQSLAAAGCALVFQSDAGGELLRVGSTVKVDQVLAGLLIPAKSSQPPLILGQPRLLRSLVVGRRRGANTL